MLINNNLERIIFIWDNIFKIQITPIVEYNQYKDTTRKNIYFRHFPVQQALSYSSQNKSLF